MPANAINKPPVAWPAIDETKYEEELMDIAFCNFPRVTIAASILFAAGCENERIIPVAKTVQSITLIFVDGVKLNFGKLTNARQTAHKK